jgi:CDGSH-type Zn-finger protein
MDKEANTDTTNKKDSVFILEVLTNTLNLRSPIILGKLYVYHSLYTRVMARVVIKCTPNGPSLIVVDGNVFAAMCRCGASKSKPYCDGTHGKIGFKADPTKITVLE